MKHSDTQEIIFHKQFKEAIQAAEHTGPVKVFSAEEIRQYEEKQKGRKV